MKKFAFKLVIFFAPLVLLFLVYILNNPNNFLGIQNFKDYKGLPIYRIREFKRNINDQEKTVLILGDSRVAHFDEYGVEILEKDAIIQNLSFGGAALNESIDMFWWAASQKKFDKVILGTSFYNMNANYTFERLQDFFKIAESETLYFTNFSYITDTLVNIKNKIIPPKKVVTDKKEYAKTIYNICENYSLAYKEIERIREIAIYCNENKIEFNIVFLPMDKSLWQNVITPLQLYDEIEEYKNSISEFATVIDFETEDNFFTTEYENDFEDGFHLDILGDGFLELKKRVYALA